MEHTHHGPPSDQPEHTGAESETHAHHPDHEHEMGAMTGMEHGGHEMPPPAEMAHAGHTPDPHAQHMRHKMPPPAVDRFGRRPPGPRRGAARRRAGRAGRPRRPRGPHRSRAALPPPLLGSLLLSIPVLVYSPMLQMWLGFKAPDFAGSNWVGPVFAGIVFLYGGVPFLQMAVPSSSAPPELDPIGNLFLYLLNGHIWFMPTIIRNYTLIGLRGIVDDGEHASYV